MADETRSDDGKYGGLDDNDCIDIKTFEQILEMDDDEEDRDFSRSIVFDFFSQAESTLTNMRKSLEDRDLKNIASLGHFLKGSSATLGIRKLHDLCAEIQHYGELKDASGTEPLDEATCLERCSECIEAADLEFLEAKRILKQFYRS